MVCPVCSLCKHWSRKGEMWVLWRLLGRPNYSHLALGEAGYCTEMVVNGPKKSAKNWGSQWYAQSAYWSHTGHEKGK